MSFSYNNQSNRKFFINVHNVIHVIKLLITLNDSFLLKVLSSNFITEFLTMVRALKCQEKFQLKFTKTANFGVFGLKKISLKIRLDHFLGIANMHPCSKNQTRKEEPKSGYHTNHWSIFDHRHCKKGLYNIFMPNTQPFNACCRIYIRHGLPVMINLSYKS